MVRKINTFEINDVLLDNDWFFDNIMFNVQHHYRKYLKAILLPVNRYTIQTNTQNLWTKSKQGPSSCQICCCLDVVQRHLHGNTKCTSVLVWTHLNTWCKHPWVKQKCRYLTQFNFVSSLSLVIIFNRWFSNPKTSLFVCLFVGLFEDFRPTWECFTHMETKKCKKPKTNIKMLLMPNLFNIRVKIFSPYYNCNVQKKWKCISAN